MIWRSCVMLMIVLLCGLWFVDSFILLPFSFFVLSLSLPPSLSLSFSLAFLLLFCLFLTIVEFPDAEN